MVPARKHVSEVAVTKKKTNRRVPELPGALGRMSVIRMEETTNLDYWLRSVFFRFAFLPFLFCIYKRDQENLETIERQDQVIKTYQIAKMIISGTAFESLKLTV